ncbi:transketolase [Streptomyces sp.]|uniref:transketolase family protein n=1 Tax=Streptomyces sp. TaxID=1931 RepID=UPI002D7946A0|nr:transketolase [Streptomyces sp.]HET6356177.1 transketolase [Streptomyces sp.]
MTEYGKQQVREGFSPLWNALDRRAVDVARTLAVDAVASAGHGHPGTAMSLAPAAYLLFQRLLRHDPGDPGWLGRDRFILSRGHSSLTLYIQLYLAGYALSLDDLKAFGTEGSCTPAHPEHGHTPGVETTTGPLGQGLGNAVGMAMAARRERGLFHPEAPPGESPFDHTIWALATDGDLDQGLSHEACALAGHQKLGNLVVLWDDNRISIEGDRTIAPTDDVRARFSSYGWDVQRVDWTVTGRYEEDLSALHTALVTARAAGDRPSFVALRTITGWPAPTKQNTGGIHGGPWGAVEAAEVKSAMGLDPERSFHVPEDVLAHTRQILVRAREQRAEWDKRYQDWRSAFPSRAGLLDRLWARTLPVCWEDSLPEFAPGQHLATRKASGEVLSAIGQVLPELWGGFGDLAGHTNTTMRGELSFVPEEFATEEHPGHRYGRTLHFGVREHAMGAVLNGIALHGGTRPYGATFLELSDCMRPSVRLAAMMGLPVIFVWTHDSIELGEDGPTHQPVEHLWSLRGIPGLDVVRPADANETVAAWRSIIERSDRPAGLCLSGQALPVLDRSPDSGLASADGVARGGYILAEAECTEPEAVLIATGSEVHIALDARRILQREGYAARVVSMPCLEWFKEQSRDYRDTVLPPDLRARVSVEAGTTLGWCGIVGEAGKAIGLEQFGASAPYQSLYRRHGLTAKRIAAAVRSSVARARRKP